MTVSTNVPITMRMKWVANPGTPGWYSVPGPTTNTQNQLMRSKDDVQRTRRKRPRNLMLNPSFYGRTRYTGWDFIDETVYVRQQADRYLDFIKEWNGYNRHGGSVWRDLSAPPDYLVQQALTKARLKLKDQNVNIGQALAERKLTADLVSSNLRKVAQAALALRRGRLRQAAQTLGISRNLYKDATFFQNWLELQYGWKPLLQDTYGAVTELSQKEEERSGLAQVTVKATSKDRAIFPRFVTESTGGGYVSFHWDDVDEYKVKVSLTYTRDNPALASAAALGLTNPLQLAWELLPFSFVVDWALPIGDFFSQLDASVGWSFNAGTLSTTTTCNRSGYVQVKNNPGTAVRSFNGTGRINGSAKMFYRTVYGSEPVAVIPVPKTFDKFASFAHVENAIALLAQAFLG